MGVCAASQLLQASEQRKGETCWKLTASKAMGLDLAMETKALGVQQYLCENGVGYFSFQAATT